MKNRNLTISEAQIKIMKYCAYQDRCHMEVNNKLLSYGLNPDEAGEIMIRLIQDKFLNEERFTRSFIRGKFRIKKWGRFKIRNALRQKDIPDKLIDMCMNEINEKDYLKCLTSLYKKKKKETGPLNTPSKIKKITTYLIQKGYEPNLVWNEIKKYQ